MHASGILGGGGFSPEPCIGDVGPEDHPGILGVFYEVRALSHVGDDEAGVDKGAPSHLISE